MKFVSMFLLGKDETYFMTMSASIQNLSAKMLSQKEIWKAQELISKKLKGSSTIRTFSGSTHAKKQFQPVGTSIQRMGNAGSATRTNYQTVEVYLPLITTKVTDFSTIQKSYLQSLSRSVNMPFVNVTLDVGTAINAFKTVWTYPEQYNNIIIHLGGFHFLK